MKPFRMIGMALVAVMLSFTMSSCDNDDDDVNPYKDYPQLIVGQWFSINPNASLYTVYGLDKSYYQIGYAPGNGWRERIGTYEISDNKIIRKFVDGDEELTGTYEIVDITADEFVYKKDADADNYVHYRVKEQFNIKGNYTYLNAAARVVPAEGKTALQLPEGVLFNGQNSISIDAMHGDRIIDVMKKFFADATFAADGKLNHTMDGEAKVKNYTLNGNNLVFNLYEGSDTYKVNATSFPDEDGDRLFIIIPKQAAWLGGMVDLVEKENEGLTLTEAQIAELEEEFMDTFETFTVILSLSKK